MHYPQIDPIIVSLGPVALRWYGLMYLLGFAAVWWLRHRRATAQQPVERQRAFRHGVLRRHGRGTWGPHWLCAVL